MNSALPATDPHRGDVCALLEAGHDRDPRAVAWREDGVDTTYAELLELVQATAGVLRRQGVGPGDRVALLMPNTLAFPAVYYGALWLGAVVVPLNPLSTDRELEYFLTDSQAVLLWSMRGTSAAAEAAQAVGVPHLQSSPADLRDVVADAEPVRERTPRTSEEADAVVIYTSGTTGQSKGARLSHRTVASSAVLTSEALDWLQAGHTVLGVLPFFHVFGMSAALNMPLYTGCRNSVVTRFAPHTALEQVVRDEVRALPAVPTMIGALLRALRSARAKGHDVDLSALRYILSGGAPLPVETLHEAEEEFGVPVREGYGLTESCGPVSFNPMLRPSRPGTVGQPLPGVEFRLVTTDGVEVPAGDTETPGELRIHGPVLMTGYLGEPQADAASFDDEGWLRTGDVATRDEEDYYRIVGRLKDIIIHGGYNVYPREVEEAFYEHPAVTEAAVLGVPDERFGEKVVAYVALQDGPEVEVAELNAFVRERLASYKWPSQVTVMDALPKNTTGKIVKDLLR
ncbi:AMP-binding protein [Micrococcus sp. ACRRV]|uniref:AMP-binding protein n=1 Tax=Micrococcus sp. ACRRV TaxID=2918203 RepID=UPI001EF22451|nr:AMP-binding protein [Micrococcus sp. ACRRV]MCG7421687.1 AMP-binding protein [Micrococcus sp. ACRRV]